MVVGKRRDGEDRAAGEPARRKQGRDGIVAGRKAVPRVPPPKVRPRTIPPVAPTPVTHPERAD
jgi:hypothetical protein